MSSFIYIFLYVPLITYGPSFVINPHSFPGILSTFPLKYVRSFSNLGIAAFGSYLITLRYSNASLDILVDILLFCN